MRGFPFGPPQEGPDAVVLFEVPRQEVGIPSLGYLRHLKISEFGWHPSYAIGNSLADLSQFGAGSLDGTFTPGPWNSVKSGNGVYGLPMDSGPMALFFNKDVFDKYKVEVPTTWEEYVAAAKALHKADPKVYIANDTGDAGFTTSMIWQAGGKPYQVDGTT